MTEILTNGHSSDGAQQELSNEYQHDRVKMIFIYVLLFCALDESDLSSRKVIIFEFLFILSFVHCFVFLTFSDILRHDKSVVTRMPEFESSQW